MSYPRNLEVFLSLTLPVSRREMEQAKSWGGGVGAPSLATSSQRGFADEGSRPSGKAGAQARAGELWAAATGRLNRCTTTSLRRF